MNMHPLIGIENRRHLVRLALAIGTSLGAAAQAGPDPFSGVSLDTSGKARCGEVVYASTCGTPTTRTTTPTAAGSVQVGAVRGERPRLGRRRGPVVRPQGLPALGVFALAQVVPLSIGADLFNAFATANGVRRYDYLGSVPTAYTLWFAIEGRSRFRPADATRRTRCTRAGFTVFGSDFHPVGETHGTVLGSDFVTEHAGVAGVSPFSASSSFGFTMNPGDFVWRP